MTPIEQTFLDLVAIDEVHPHEREVLAYIKKRLDTVNVAYRQDKAGNIVAAIEGSSAEAIALVGHVDIAAPLGGRQVVVTPNAIKTDGRGLLGGDDKAAVAAMLELADRVNTGALRPARPIELIFTVGEEAGCVGAVALDMSLVKAKKALVLDWTGRVNRIVSQSPAYVKIDVEYIGVDAHPAHWQDGKNAGAALIEAAGQLRQGEYVPGVTCNIGIFGFGKARNQVPGRATLQAELRSHDSMALETAVVEIGELFKRVAHKHDLEANIDFANDSAAYKLDESGQLFADVSSALAKQNLQPELEATFGGFDGNILAARGIEVIMLGAGYYSPHSPSEYLDRAEFAELLDFLCKYSLTISE